MEAERILIGGGSMGQVFLEPRYANRHGLIGVLGSLSKRR